MRVELFFREPSAALITIGLLGSHSGPKFPTITGYNLPNKVNNDPLLANARTIRESFPDTATTDLCVHYSLKYHATKRGEQTVAQFREFLSSCDEGISNVLLVSGGAGGAPGKPRAAMNTVTCLAQLRCENYMLPPGKEIGVAFNPYYPTPAAREDEWQRLRDKLDSGYVTSVWLNMGSDTAILQETLEQLAAMNLKERGVRVLGSLFVPSKALLAKFKFRMWSGLYLSEEYLASVEGAMRITADIISLYEQHSVEPIIESAIRTAKEVQQLSDLFASRNAAESMDVETAATMVAATNGDSNSGSSSGVVSAGTNGGIKKARVA